MPVVDVSFPLKVGVAPRDHGYVLYAAISRVAPKLHGASWLGVHPLTGRPAEGGLLDLSSQASLRLRLPVERMADIMPLVGSRLEISGHAGALGAPTVHNLIPSASLDARLVAVKLTDAPHRDNAELGRKTLDVAAFQSRYASEIERQLAAIDIRKPFEICGRRSMAVAGRRIIGFSVRVSQLTAEESVRLQERGLGGKRRMGCGMFRSTRGR